MMPSRSLHDLKIIVTSTPKTGNNWVKQLLAATSLSTHFRSTHRV